MKGAIITASMVAIVILWWIMIEKNYQSCPSPDSQVMEQQEQIIQQNQWIIDFLNANIK